jgi:hypothetical protein
VEFLDSANSLCSLAKSGLVGQQSLTYGGQKLNTSPLVGE